jgi:hypothetical protein
VTLQVVVRGKLILLRSFETGGVGTAENEKGHPAGAESGEREEGQRRRVHTARDVSQGEIILRTPLRKAVFLGASVAMVLVAVILGVLAVAF